MIGKDTCQILDPRHKKYRYFTASALQFNNDPGEIRTHDPQFRRLLLYPAELPDHNVPKVEQNYYMEIIGGCQTYFSFGTKR